MANRESGAAWSQANVFTCLALDELPVSGNKPGFQLMPDNYSTKQFLSRTPTKQPHIWWQVHIWIGLVSPMHRMTME